MFRVRGLKAFPSDLSTGLAFRLLHFELFPLWRFIFLAIVPFWNKALKRRFGGSLEVLRENKGMPNASKESGSGLPMIECSCGAKILLVPSVKEMDKSIEAHIEQHIKHIKSAKEADAEAERIHDDLITKVIEKAAEM